MYSEERLASVGSSPPSNVQKDLSTASSQLSKLAPVIEIVNIRLEVNGKMRNAFDEISGLKERNRLRVGEAHGVFQIKIALSIVTKTLVCGLHHS